MASGALLLVSQFDDLVRCYNILLESSCEKEFIQYVSNQEECRKRWLETIKECNNLKMSLEAANKVVSETDRKLTTARRWLDSERLQRKKVEAERDSLLRQLNNVREILFMDGCKVMTEETREKLSFLNSSVQEKCAKGMSGYYDRLNTIKEADYDPTMSHLSDTSFSRSEDDLDDYQLVHKSFRKHRQSGTGEELVSAKRRRSSLSKTPVRKSCEIFTDGNEASKVVATTSMTVSPRGLINAQSVLEAFKTPSKPKCNQKRALGMEKKEPFNPTAPSPPTSDSGESDQFWQDRKNEAQIEHVSSPFTPLNHFQKMQHTFEARSTIFPELCLPCEKRIGFAREAYRCTRCHAIAHPQCKEKVALPCVPMNTPAKSGIMGVISDYAPLVPPMIPAIVIHCVSEVQRRGLEEVGIYRIPGSEKEVQALKKKFLEAKGAPDLSKVEIHAVCGCLRSFLRSLQDNLLPRCDWPAFLNAVKQDSVEDKQASLFKAISDLPQANRDTLAYLMIHLQLVADAQACKMPISSLALVFGPTLVGTPVNTPASAAYAEVDNQRRIVEELLKLPTDYWSNFIVEPCSSTAAMTPCGLRNTPSTESLMRKTSKRFLYTPNGKRRYFDTPPSCKKPR